jgi:protoporphyrinogen oxidase
MRVWKVGIVGGGPGGLMTAYALQKLASEPVRTTIFEASPRLGGKILTPKFQKLPVRYEAGAAEFYDYSQFDDDPLKELIAELGLSIRPMGGPAVVMNQQILSNLDDIQRELGPAGTRAMLEFDRRAKDQITPQEFYYSDHPEGDPTPPETCRFDKLMTKIGDPRAQTYIESLIHSDLATEPKETSICYGLQNYLMNDPAYMALYGIEGGNELLPIELAARLYADILLEHQVQSIARLPNGKLAVTAVDRQKPSQPPQREEFDFVVVALPLAHLNSIHYIGERLGTALKRHTDYYDYPAHYLRITILFEQPFWRATLSDSYWMLDHFGGCCLYDESSRDPGSTHGILGWLLGGEVACEMSRRTDEELIAAALDSLPEFLRHGRHDMLEGHVHRWIGAVNGLPGGLVAKNHDQRHQPEPVEHPNLFLVGDYMFDSTLNGVLDSADYVAAWLAAQMAAGETTPPRKSDPPPQRRQVIAKC